MSAEQRAETITAPAVLKSIYRTEKWREDLRKKDWPKVKEFLRLAVATYQDLEKAAQKPLHITAEDIKSVKVLWDISAPGDYFRASKDDRYHDKEWALWADRQRLNRTFRIGRTIAEARAGRVFKGNSPKVLQEMEEYLPYIVYNGRPDENAALMEAISTPWLRIPEGLGYPQSKVSIITPLDRIFDNSYNLTAQLQTFRVPYVLDMSQQSEVGVVISAAQGVRFLYGLGNVENVIPGNRPIRIFPLPTPQSGVPEYPTQEIRGTVFYRFIANPAVVGDKPYPYKV